jgi:hypothetical protein
MRARRWLSRPSLSAERLAWFEESVRMTGTKGWGFVVYRTELALARQAADPKKEKRAAEATLAELEDYARKEHEGDRSTRDALLLQMIPLVRILRGDAAAATLWLEAETVSHERSGAAFDAALSLEATNHPAEAEAAYRTTMSPENRKRDALKVMAAHIKLAALYRSQKRVDEAAKLEGVLDRLWKGADAGVREAIQKLK